MEAPKIRGRIQMERFIPVEIFWKKSNTFRGITFFFGFLVPVFMSRGSENLYLAKQVCAIFQRNVFSIRDK